MTILRFLLVALCFGLSPVHLSTALAEENPQTDLQKQLQAIGANVIFMRHALAPGTGDPGHFDINDCSTQRNLDQRGRKQARDIGFYLKAQNIAFSEILSSQWCRCIDTVKEMDIGGWQEFFGLNSFFNGHVDKTDVLRRLNDKLATLKETDLALMVTHQVVITATTGIFPASGEMIAYNTRTGQFSRIPLIK